MKPFDLNLRHLHALRAIVENGSMTAASSAANMSQPALTQGLARMERALGVTLFDRQPSGVRLTDAGRVMTERAQAAIGHLERASREILRGGKRGFARPERLMTSTQLRALLAVADAGSFAGASVATLLSEPALHRAVRDLEQIGGVTLAERRGRGIQLTQAGRRLARGIRLAAAELSAAFVELGADGYDAGQVVVGTMPLARARVLPNAIADFVGEQPRVPVKVVEGSWRELVEPLRDGLLDLMIGAMRDDLPSDLEQRALFEDGLAVVARAHHPLAGVVPDMSQLASFGWIVSSAGTPLRGHWERLFEDRALPEPLVECGSVTVIRGVLVQSDLLTLLSPDQVAAELEAGTLAIILRATPSVVRRVGLITRAGWRPTAAPARFLACLGRAASQSSGKPMESV
jgi:DNA-binding transcriptional LysR family regulator